MTDASRTRGPAPHLSLLAAWALAFGCAVGWDSFTLPLTAFLPAAGPLGALLGILAGGLVMGVVAWNYHFLMNRRPGPGGVYEYAKAAFGVDHGFLCAWFLALVYATIVWADATALVAVSRFWFGRTFHFGPVWTVAGNPVCVGDTLTSVCSVALAAAACCRRRLAGRLQTVMALVFFLGVVACFAAAARGGDFSMPGPAFAPDGGPRLVQVLGVLSVSPWLFVGFESISNASGEFRFPLRRSFAVMVAVIAAAVLAYAMLLAVPVFSPGERAADWTGALAGAGSDPETAAYALVARPLGRLAAPVLMPTLFVALFTNLVGNTFAASRLLAAMAEDGALPRWFGRRNADGSPRNAVLAVAAVSLVTSPLGRTIVGVILDTALVGASVAYAYASAAAFKTARAEGRRFPAAAGLAGLALSVALAVLYAVPNVLFHENAPMSTESYFFLALWCVAGLLTFLSVFRRDRDYRFGRSPVVWISLLAMVLFLTVLWVRQSFRDEGARMVARIEAAEGDDAQIRSAVADAAAVGKLDNVLQTGITLLSFALLYALYRILVRRERDLEREKSKARSYFFSTVSHDIRTPLNAIIGYSEMLKTGFKTEEERDAALDSILAGGRTLLGLVNDVLDLSKLENGRMQLVAEPTDVARLLREIADVFRLSGGKPGLDIRCAAGGMPPLLLDPQRLRQIAFNLAGNAVKFTEKGFVELRASWDPATGAFRFEVEDTGCGIPAEDKARIVSAWVQVGSRTGRNGGTGLGLAICNQLAAAMGGKLSVESEPGRGSTFSLEVPGVRAAEAVVPAAPAAVPASAAPASGAASALRVLVVDDSKMNRMVLEAQLKRLGSPDVAAAPDGREALAVLRAPGAAPFDLVLTDVWMPDLGGEGLLREIRADPALRGLRVVAVTADVEFRAKVAEAGFDGMLLKPVTIAALAEILPGGFKHG